MTAWLDPVRRALAARPTPVRLFLRDDDAGWDDHGLQALLDTCGRHRLPIDVAVIPAEVTDARAAWLLHEQRRYPARLGLHQHGWAHANHEAAGRKCEFGASRRPVAWRDDVARGQQVLGASLGRAVDAIFTPPWNRCAPALGSILVDLGFTVLSRDASAAPLDTPHLAECPVHVDWSAKRHGAPQSAAAIGAACATALATQPVVGLLFHHAVMDAEDLARAGALLALLAASPLVDPVSLLEATAFVGGSAAVPMAVERHA